VAGFANRPLAEFQGSAGVYDLQRTAFVQPALEFDGVNFGYVPS
jgi:hypothetical protein